MTRSERYAFRAYLRAMSDAQVQGVYDKEKQAQREEEMELAQEEARYRGITLAG